MHLNMTNDEFINKYVKKPYMDFCISFRYKNKMYQFDFNGVYKPTDIPGKTPYDFVVWEKDWKYEISRTPYKNLMEAITNARFEGLTFKEIYDSDDSELIDIS